MKLVKRRYEDVVILSLSGTFDEGRVPLLKERVDSLIAEGDSKIILDGPGLEFVSSAAIGYMVRLARQSEVHGGALVLARPSEFLKRSLVTLNLLSLFPMYEDVQKALMHLVQGVDVEELDLSDIDEDDSLVKEVPVTFRVVPEGGGEGQEATGRIVNLREDSLLIRYGPVPDEELQRLGLELGVTVHLTFQQPFVIRDYTFELEGHLERVTRLEQDGVDHGVSFRVKYGKVKDEDRVRLGQFVRDQNLWKVEQMV